MSNDADRKVRYVNPRPEFVKALGIVNIVLAVLISMCVTLMTGWYLLAVAVTPKTMQVPMPPTPAPPPPSPVSSPSVTTTPPAEGKADTTVNASPAVAPTPAPPANVTISINPLMGMDDPNFVTFCVVDLVTALIVNLALFISGIGLVRVERWGMLWSNWTSGIKIARLVLLWCGFLFLVAPELSRHIAESVVRMIPPNARMPGPDIKLLSRVYLLTNAVMTVVVILFGIIYPVIALIVASRPGFRAAFRAKGPILEEILP